MDIFQIRIVFLLLNFANLFIFWIVGTKLRDAKSPKRYWMLSLWCIVSYAVVMGLRFGRMIDYNVYFERYNFIGNHFAKSDYEVSFKAICWFLYNIDIPYWGFICICSILLIVAILFFLEKNRMSHPWALLLFLWESHNAENFIRWFLSFAFFLFFVRFLQDKKYKSAAVFAAIAATTHVGVVLLIAVVLAVRFCKRLLLPTWLSESLFVLSLLLGTISIMTFLNDYIQLLGINNGDGRVGFYLSQYGSIVSGNFGHAGLRGALDFTNNIRILLAYSFPLFMIPILVKQSHLQVLFANLFIIGVIINPIFSQVEILNRFGEGLQFFSVVVSSVAYTYVFKNKRINNKMIQVWGGLSLIANLWPVISDIINRTEWYYMLYIWDAGSRNVLPYNYFV